MNRHDPQFWLPASPLVLASGSSIRRDLLSQAGIPTDLHPSGLDERQVEADFAKGAENGTVDAGELALHLAKAKALRVSRQFAQPRDGHERLVLGADQTLSLTGEILHKAGSRAEAAERLAKLSGREHRLHAAFAIAREGRILGSGIVVAQLTMRDLSAAYIETYLAAAWPDISASVGLYQLENLGPHLFSRIEGDYFAILGLPLLPLLAILRELGALSG